MDKIELSNRNKALLIAVEKGYKIIEGIVYNPKGQIVKGHAQYGYLRFGIKTKQIRSEIAFHRPVAYQKYGNKIFEPGIVCR